MLILKIIFILKILSNIFLNKKYFLKNHYCTSKNIQIEAVSANILDSSTFVIVILIESKFSKIKT